jgi:hypothetical protein
MLYCMVRVSIRYEITFETTDKYNRGAHTYISPEVKNVVPQNKVNCV